MGTPDYLISAAVTLVLAQRLARKTCSECRVVDEHVTPKLLATTGFSLEQASRTKIYKGKGCDKCTNGYKGRMGIYEVLVISKDIKQSILAKATTPQIRDQAIKEGFKTMQDMARGMMLHGDLSFEEFERVIGSSN